jgi:hypothetical protein
VVVTRVPRKYDVSSRECYWDKAVGTNPGEVEDLTHCRLFRYTHWPKAY